MFFKAKQKQYCNFILLFLVDCTKDQPKSIKSKAIKVLKKIARCGLRRVVKAYLKPLLKIEKTKKIARKIIRDIENNYNRTTTHFSDSINLFIGRQSSGFFFYKPQKIKIVVQNKKKETLQNIKVKLQIPFSLDYISSNKKGKWYESSRVVEWELAEPDEGNKKENISVTFKGGRRFFNFIMPLKGVVTHKKKLVSRTCRNIFTQCPQCGFGVASGTYDTEDPVKARVLLI